MDICVKNLDHALKDTAAALEYARRQTGKNPSTRPHVRRRSDRCDLI